MNARKSIRARYDWKAADKREANRCRGTSYNHSRDSSMIPKGEKIPYPPNRQCDVYDDQPPVYFTSSLLNPGILIRVNIMFVAIVLVHVGHLFSRLRGQSSQSKETANGQSNRRGSNLCNPPPILSDTQVIDGCGYQDRIHSDLPRKTRLIRRSAGRQPEFFAGLVHTSTNS